jgi:hypothetical protein
VTVSDQPGLNWTVVLRRRPARVVAGRPEGGYTDAFEIVCCDCADHPDMDYRDVSAELQRIRGPYPIAAGIAAYVEHVRLHQRQSLHPAGHPAHGGAGRVRGAGD